MLGPILIALAMGNAFMVIYQLGHLIAAKAASVSVTRIYVGIGPEMARVRVGETAIVVGWLPLGSYLRLGGVDDEMLAWVDGRHWQPDSSDLASKRPMARALVICGGSLTMVVSAVLIHVSSVSVFGVPHFDETRIGDVAQSLPDGAEALQSVIVGSRVARVGETTVSTWQGVQAALVAAPPGELQIEFREPSYSVEILISSVPTERRSLAQSLEVFIEPAIGYVVPGSAADRSGLRPGDQIRAVDGTPTQTWWQLQDAIRDRPSQRARFEVIREDQFVEVVVDLGVSEEIGPDGSVVRIGVAGISPPTLPLVYQRTSMLTGLEAALSQVYATILLQLRFLGDLVTGEVPLTAVGGAVSAGRQLASVFGSPPPTILRYQALRLVNAALLTLLLPFPPAPGGYLVFLLAEVVRGKRPSVGARLNWTWFGVILIGALILTVQTSAFLS